MPTESGLSNAGQNCRIACTPDVVDRDALNQPQPALPNQFDVITVFHEAVARVIVLQHVLCFDERVQMRFVTVNADSWVADGVRRVDLAE